MLDTQKNIYLYSIISLFFIQKEIEYVSGNVGQLLTARCLNALSLDVQVFSMRSPFDM